MSVRRYIKQLAGESAVYGISGTIGKFIGVFLIPLYTRVFTPSDYGVIALITAMMGLVGMFVVLGLDNSAARWYYDSDSSRDRRSTISSWFWCHLVTATAFAGLLATMARPISVLLFETPEYANLVRLAAIGLPLSGVAALFHKFCRYRRRVWPAVVFSTSRTLGTIGLIVLFVLVWRRGLDGLYTAQLAAASVAGLAALTMLRGWVAPAAFSWDRLKEMLRFGLPLVPAAIAFWVMTSSDRFILKMYWANDEIGLYAVAATLAGGVALVVGAFAQAWGPFAYSILGEEASGRVYARVLDLYGFLSCGLCTGIALFAPLLLRVLTTEPYYPAASCVAFLAFACAFEGARYIASLGSGVAKNSKPIAMSVGIGAAANIGLNFVLIPSFGRNGAAVATMVAYGCAVVYLFVASQKHYHIPYRWHISLVCVGFSWMLIGIDWCFIPGVSVTAFAIRIGLLALFVPLGMVVGLIKWSSIAQVLQWPAAERISAIAASQHEE